MSRIASPTNNINGPNATASRASLLGPMSRILRRNTNSVGQTVLRETESLPYNVQSSEFRPNAGISVLPHSEGTEITGGQFNAVGGNQIRVEVNVNGMETKGPQGHTPPLMASNRTEVNPEDIQDVETTGSHASLPEFPENSERGGSRVAQPFNNEPYAIYFRCLATRERGSPLWIPETNRFLPIEYQRNGLVIGDVGIITDQGCFDSLFNITLPPDDPLAINSDALPQNFVPLMIKNIDKLKSSRFKKGTSLSSGSVSVTRDDSSSGLTFESSASEGAILTLPDGSNSEDLRNKKKLRDYLAVHLEEIYRCALIEHGREIKNGDLRIVTGFDKTKSWGMAAFSNLTSQTRPSFRLEFRPRDQRTIGQTHNWKSSGTAEVKAGPDTEEVVALRMGDPSQQDVEYENQSVFVRTENATLSSSIWNALLSEAGIADLELDDTGSHSGSGAPPCSGNSTTRARDGQTSTFGSPFASINTLAIHPSNAINAMLLKLNPSAWMAITGDDIWTSVLKEDDTILPSAETLWTRIMESYIIHVENGIVFLGKSETETPLVHTEMGTTAKPLRGRHVVFSESSGSGAPWDHPEAETNALQLANNILWGNPETELPDSAFQKDWGTEASPAYTEAPECPYVNPIFASTSYHSFDISKHPSAMFKNHKHLTHVWSQPATVPPMSSMVLLCNRIPRIFTIIPQGSAKFVTVRDVLEGLYTALRKNVTAAELELLPNPARFAVTKAYNSRCKRFLDTTAYERELAKGVKRVDFLGKHSYLAGIKLIDGKANGWAWQLSTTKEPVTEALEPSGYQQATNAKDEKMRQKKIRDTKNKRTNRVSQHDESEAVLQLRAMLFEIFGQRD